MANDDQSIEYPKIRYNLILSQMEFFRAGIQWTAIPVVPGQIQPVPDDHIIVGNSGNVGTPVLVSGDGTLDNAGVLTVTDVHYPVTVYTVDATPHLTQAGVYVAAASTIKATLPVASSVTGQIFYFNGMQSSSFEIDVQSGEKIDGTTDSIDVRGTIGRLISDGANWYTI